MSTIIWPAPPSITSFLHPFNSIPDNDELQSLTLAAQKAELSWLLPTLHRTLPSLSSALSTCANLLSSNTSQSSSSSESTPSKTSSGSTLALSSQRSEALKGFVVLSGSKIVKGDIWLRLATLPPFPGANNNNKTWRLKVEHSAIEIEQIACAKRGLNHALDIVDVTRWSGYLDDAGFMKGQLKLLSDEIRECKDSLTGNDDKGGEWWENSVDGNCFEPKLPDTISVWIGIVDAGLVMEVRTLQILGPVGNTTGTNVLGIAQGNAITGNGYAGVSFRERLTQAFTGVNVTSNVGARLHDEADQIFVYKQNRVRVREKVRVEAADPRLMAVSSKLGALENTVALSRKALSVVMG